MRVFFAGCLCGVLLSGVAYASVGPRISGQSGYLTGFRVKVRGGEIVCRDPWVWLNGEDQGGDIECDKR